MRYFSRADHAPHDQLFSTPSFDYTNDPSFGWLSILWIKPSKQWSYNRYIYTCIYIHTSAFLEWEWIDTTLLKQLFTNPFICPRIAELQDDALLVITERTMTDIYEAW